MFLPRHSAAVNEIEGGEIHVKAKANHFTTAFMLELYHSYYGLVYKKYYQ